MSRIRRSPSRSVTSRLRTPAARARPAAAAARRRPAGPWRRRRGARRRARRAPSRRPASRAVRSSAGRRPSVRRGGQAACLAAERLPAGGGRGARPHATAGPRPQRRAFRSFARVSASTAPISCRLRHAATARANRSASRSASGPLPTSGRSDRHSSSIGTSCASTSSPSSVSTRAQSAIARRDGLGALARAFGRLVGFALAARDRHRARAPCRG